MLNLEQPYHGYFLGGIEDLDVDELKQCFQLDETRGKLIGFIGGPPCPDFSIGGKNRGKNGENGRLSQVFVDLICEKNPHFFCLKMLKVYTERRNIENFSML